MQKRIEAQSMDRRVFLTGLACFIGAAPAVAGDETIRLRDLYNKDLSFSDYAETMQGTLVAVSGFIAPPPHA